MNAAELFANLPRGKEDKPLLFAMGPLVYDFHDIDGLYFMLDRKLSGCLVMMWAKPMDPEVAGTVTLDGEPVEGCVLHPMAAMGGMWILGVPLRGRVTEYGREYALHVEGYADIDGNTMNPQDFTVTGMERVSPDPAFAAHEAVALRAAREGIVLMRNENHALPLRPGALNLFGKAVHEFRTTAVGAGKINPRYSVNFLEAVQDREGYEVNRELVEFYGLGRDETPGRELLDRAKALSDTAIVFISRPAGENMDSSSAKGEFYLDNSEDGLIRQLTGEFAHVIAVLNVGYPMDVSWAERYGVDGLVYNGFGGMLAGPALLDVLTGAENPSGKLPDTWAMRYEDIPASWNFYDCKDRPRLDAEATAYVDTVYEEDIYVGYRYFSTFGKRPAYPFGFGLSYTDFVVEPDAICWDGSALTMKIFVKNMGRCPGKEVVQVYVGKPDTELEKPERELVWFGKTGFLAPGDVDELRVEVPKSHLQAYSEELAAYVLDPGEYRVYAGNSSLAPMCGSFRVESREILKRVRNRMAPTVEFTRLSKRDPEGTFPQGRLSGIVEGKSSFMPYAKRGDYPAEFAGKARETPLTFEDVRREPSLAGDFTAQMTVEELARVSVCASAGWGMEGVGEAGSVFSPEGYDLPRFPVADGNSGVNLNIRNIGMPSGATLCASFDRELCREVGRVIGQEAKALGIPMILAPALNLHRNPLNGRQPEYFSEDPYLAGTLAGAYAQGLEGAGTASCMKHFIANNAESSRKRNQSVISERAIRELYLRAFEYAMEAHMPAAVMTAYNAVNGCPTAADPDLLLGILREELGFEGFIMTDWTTYDTVDVAAMVQAGNCWITPGSLDGTYTAPIVEGVKDGGVDLARLRSNVASLVGVLARFS